MSHSQLQHKVFISTRPKGKSKDLKRWFATTLIEKGGKEILQNIRPVE